MTTRTVLAEMIRCLGRGPATVRCPAEKLPVPPGFRGRVALSEERCIGCGKCVQVCPAGCITMVKDEKEVVTKGKTIRRKRRPEILVFRCIRCGLCVEACLQEPKAIAMTEAFLGSGPDRFLVVR